jgi:ankyrin repeat protein
MLSRRAFLCGVSAAAWERSNAPAGAQSPTAVTRELWLSWLVALATMQACVIRHEWYLDGLKIAPPATEDEIRQVELKHSVSIPPQLRDVLRLYSAGVQFGWSIPALYRPFKALDLPGAGGLPIIGDLRSGLWNLRHIDGTAIDNFRSMRENFAKSSDGGEPNKREMWDNQFPFAKVGRKDDALTIDMSLSEGPQPIRYFSSEREGIHGRGIAPDFVSFLTAYTRLGCAGDGQDDWFRFIDPNGDLRYLNPDGEGARRWSAWLARDPKQRDPDEPPRPVAAKTKADFNLLDAARDGSFWGVEAALAAGGVIDCVDGNQPNRQGNHEITYETALTLAVRRRDLAMAQRLLDAGAEINTRLLSLSVASRYGTVDVMQWLIAHGARANGWKGDLEWPLVVLLGYWSKDRPGGDASTIPMLETLLAAGADPNARWYGQKTILMWTRPEVIEVLLEHGADPNLYDIFGDTALHQVKSAEAVRLLVAHGADPNAMSQLAGWPNRPDPSARRTPYQALLKSTTTVVYGEPLEAILDALAASGADPRKRDGVGRSSLWYCQTVAQAGRLVELGLDPRERATDGATLLHNIVKWANSGAIHGDGMVALLKYYQGLGLDINAATSHGDTALHLAADRCNEAVIALLLNQGADKTIRDKEGRRPADRAPRSCRKGLDLL